MMLQRLNDAIAASMTELGLDHRLVYTRAASLPPDGSQVEFECSDDALADDVVERLHLVGDEARALRVTRLPSAGLPPLLTPVSSVADIRRAPAHPSELVTQAICGDRLVPLKAEGDWFLVRLDDGYLGWIRSWHVAASDPARAGDFSERAAHRVSVNHTEVLTAPDPQALPLTDLVVGTPLVVTPGGRRGWLEAELPDGRHGYIRRAHVARKPREGKVARERLAETGLRFVGIPYLWGGNTPQGFDCSGLVQRIYRLHGVLLPRDSDQQAAFGKEKTGTPVGHLATGDLVFFGRTPGRITHVGMVLPDRTFLHAYGQVRVNSLDPSSPLFAPDLARDWRVTRDPLA
jgi:hypothetical protein